MVENKECVNVYILLTREKLCVCVFIPVTSISSLFHSAVMLSVYYSHPAPFFDFNYVTIHFIFTFCMYHPNQINIFHIDFINIHCGGLLR